MSNHPLCLICELVTQSFQDKAQEDEYEVNCYRCGSYVISKRAWVAFTKYFEDKRKRMNLSGWVRENQPNAIIKYIDFEKLSVLQTPQVGERATNLLIYIVKNFPNIGSTFSRNRIYQIFQALESPNFPGAQGIDKNEASILVPMFSVSWSLNWHELEFLLDDYLCNEKGYIENISSKYLKITSKGWSFIDDLNRQRIDSQIAFIAMKFDKDLIQYSKDWIEKGILDAGYQPKAMYEHQHNNIIDDEMIALIKRSRFVVVDLTRKSLGAYYEAGFGHGYGLDVIFLCEKSYFKKYKMDIHFDVNHRSIIRWEKNKGEELAKMLQNRIESTPIGKGGYNRQHED